MPFDGNDGENRSNPLAMIYRVIALLSGEGRWCQQRLHTRDGRLCLQGALTKAGATATLKQPILRAIREVTGRDDFVRVEMFNDQPLTTQELVIDVLYRARRNIAATLAVTGTRLSPTEPTYRPAEAPSYLVSPVA